MLETEDARTNTISSKSCLNLRMRTWLIQAHLLFSYAHAFGGPVKRLGLITPHAQRERGKVIGRGVHIYIYIYIYMSVVEKNI